MLFMVCNFKINFWLFCFLEFRKRLYLNKSKIEQDAYLLKYMEVTVPKRYKIEPSQALCPKSVTIKYLIKADSQTDYLYICAKAFQTITGMLINLECKLEIKTIKFMFYIF